MSWLLSIILSWLPDLWVLAAMGAAGLWLYGWLCPARIAAEVVRVGSLGLVGLSVWLWTWAGATAACEARTAAATATEVARQSAISTAAIETSRREGAVAMAAAAQARADLDAALDAAERHTSTTRCGLSKRWVGALPK